MGIAITSGVLASLHSQSPLHGLKSGQPKWESHTPGTSTPVVADVDDPTLPSRFIACVQREESARRLREKFRAVLGGGAIEVTVGDNLSAVQQSDVVLLWYARFIIIIFGTLPLTNKNKNFSCKPQGAYPVLNENGIKEALAGKLLISILTGVTIAQLSAWVLPSTTVVRAMPNVACRVRLCLSLRRPSAFTKGS
jgi:pyrroline-5-carboxylate reductase